MTRRIACQLHLQTLTKSTYTAVPPSIKAADTKSLQSTSITAIPVKAPDRAVIAAEEQD